MLNLCDSPCGHTHIKYDIPTCRCQTIVIHHAVTHIKYDIPRCQIIVAHHVVTHIKYDIPTCRCQTIVTHHAVTHILNMTYLDVKPL